MAGTTETTQLDSYLKAIYRFCDDPCQVNWQARRKIDSNFYKNTVIPSAIDFLIRHIPDITFEHLEPSEKRSMSAIIGLSGGLDSVVTSYLNAEAMKKTLEEEKMKSASLALVHFQNLEDTPVSKVIRDLKQKYPEINIIDIEANLNQPRKALQNSASGLVKKLGGQKIINPGELTTRTICQILNETGNRAGYATIDTTNGTEYILGEFTVGLGYDLSVLSDLWKSSVFEIGRILQVPPQCLDLAPRNSAFSHTTKPELYFGKLPEEVTPEHTYQVLDPILHWLYERKKSPEEVAEKLGHDPKFIANIQRRIKNQEYRRKIPVFCIQDRTLNFKNQTTMPGQEVNRKMDEMMLGDKFQ